MDYGINDYKSKTELTADRLVTSVIGALRHYQLCTELKRARYNEVLTMMQLEAEARDKKRLEQRLNAERRGELAVLGDAMEDYVHTELMASIADINRRVLPLRLSLRSELHGEEYDSFIVTLGEVAERLGGVAETLRGIIGAIRPD
ncbi:MAG: hypothetical protein NVV74_18530 [Magnetospirillum sp.]|nr:hypothetical protein [Magnetospirillum sp.]